MSIRCRPMRPKDVAGCVEIVAQHPFIGPRYAGTLPELRSVWLSLLGREAFRAYVYEDRQDSPPRLVGVGCSAMALHLRSCVRSRLGARSRHDLQRGGRCGTR